MTENERLAVLKTYKLFINGKFVRSESGRYFVFKHKEKTIANIALGSKKDLRDAVVAARAAWEGWNFKTAYNKSQILYRLAEIVEGRKTQFIEAIGLEKHSKKQAENVVDLAIDSLVYYAGWADKYNQIFGNINPVAQPYFNFSAYESMGVVGIIAPENNFLGAVHLMATTIVGGNVCVVLGSQENPLSLLTLSEAIATADIPNGVINILTGQTKDLVATLAQHMDVNAIINAAKEESAWKTVQENAFVNVKRIKNYAQTDWLNAENLNPYFILDTQELKTLWYPIDNFLTKKSAY